MRELEVLGTGLRRARGEIDRRLDGSHWLRFRSRYLPLRRCAEPAPSLSAVRL